MSTIPALARPFRAEAEPGRGAPGRWRRYRPFAAGALAGWALALLAGDRLSTELQAWRILFIPFSAAMAGLAALGAAALADEAAVRRRHLRAAMAALCLSVAVLLALYVPFVVRVSYGDAKSAAFVVGWSRSPACSCQGSDGDCIASLGLDPARIDGCWKGRSAIELALALAYLATLAGAGSLAGLSTAPPRPPPGQPAAPPPGYLDFDLWIDRAGDGYRAKAWSAAGFDATVRFALPPSLAGGEPVRFGFADPRRGGAAPELPGPGADPRAVGGELFRAIFQGELLQAFQGCLERSREGSGVRLRLRLDDVPALAGLPWEYLYDAQGGGFLALSLRTPVVRYLELARVLPTLQVEPPLRVLVVISTPSGYQELAQADEEWRRLGEVLAPLVASGRIQVERLPRATPDALARRLRDGAPVHVLHFVGHGGWSDLRGQGVLVFEDEEGKGLPFPGQSLAYLLQDHPSLRLAVLNACNGARASREDAFAGTAQSLVQHGVPAVIAMQSEVMDRTACRFAGQFYRGLAAGLPVDACVGEARQALAADENPEWGTPALFLRAADGRLFGLAAGEGER